MLAFRPALVAEDSQPLTPNDVPRICDEVIDRANFLVSPACELRWSRKQEEPCWELFFGQALGRSQTRERRRFDSWWVSTANGDPDEPLLALRWDREANRIYVTRAIECRVREGYESEPGVFESRTITRWMRELVGTVDLKTCATCGRLRDELQGLLLQTVVGTSRLPITSLESPLPAFTLGQLMYSFRARGIQQAVDSTDERFENAKRLEFALRSGNEVAAFAAVLVQTHSNTDDWLSLLFTSFNAASLSPYTEFVPRAVALLRHLTGSNFGRRADFIARLILLLDRHLCAYDLVKFHHRGANYPDALLVDELWRELLNLVERDPTLFAFRADDSVVVQRRRALRHALLLRLEYAGHPVPDWPTSIGENARVMPAPFAELPEEQIHAPTRRKRKLFDSQLAPNHCIWTTLDDLSDPQEVRELGTALFLNRPLGIGKQPGEPDRTPLLSHVLVSRTIAERRWTNARRRFPQITMRWPKDVDGVPLTDFGPPPKPGVVSLHDAMLSADDWMALRTTRSSLRDWDAAFEWAALGLQPSRDWRLVLPDGDNLVAFDEQFKPVARIAIDGSEGYRLRGGVEAPVAGLLVAPTGSSNNVRILPAFGE